MLLYLRWESHFTCFLACVESHQHCHILAVKHRHGLWFFQCLCSGLGSQWLATDAVVSCELIFFCIEKVLPNAHSSFCECVKTNGYFPKCKAWILLPWVPVAKSVPLWRSIWRQITQAKDSLWGIWRAPLLLLCASEQSGSVNTGLEKITAELVDSIPAHIRT